MSYFKFTSKSVIVIFSFLISHSTTNLLLAGTGMHGSMTIVGSNIIVNEYTTLNANAVAGAYTITVGSSSLNANSRFPNNLQPGELVLIIQMQGATMNTANPNSITWGAVTAYNNSGKFEFNEVAGTPSGTTISLVYPLTNSYSQNGKVQVVRIPRYTTLHINNPASVTAPAWNGSTGGIVAAETNGSTVIQGTIDVTGKGFRGGIVDSTANSNHIIYASALKGDGAEKGEGIAGDKTVYDLLGGRYGRGAPANGGGGGNSHNAGGGGGANAGNIALWNGLGNPDTITSVNWKTAWDLEGGNFHTNISTGGGRGGYTYSMKNKDPLTFAPGNTGWNGDDRSNVGGLGGRPLDNSGNRIFFGGGGGAGDNNNNSGTGGANGGGIVYLLSGGAVTGNGIINANGAIGLNSTANDAAGGGGGGGTVVIYTNSAPVNSITVNAKGGKGGNQQRIANSSGEGEGPGGGGGGGLILISNVGSVTTSTTGGVHGTTNSPTFVNFLPNGATMGFAGAVSFPTNPYSGDVPLPITLLDFSGKISGNKIKLSWVTGTEINNDYFTLEKSDDGFNFHSLEMVEGAGTSLTQKSYSVIDENPVFGNNYYRLLQTDFDGTTTKSSIICIRYGNSIRTLSIISLQPNPVNDFAEIEFATPVTGTIQMKIMDSTGKLILEETLMVNEGFNSVEFSGISKLAKGFYFVRLQQNEKLSEVLKFCKQ